MEGMGGAGTGQSGRRGKDKTAAMWRYTGRWTAPRGGTGRQKKKHKHKKKKKKKKY